MDAGNGEPEDCAADQDLKGWLELHAAAARDQGAERTALVAIRYGSLQYRDVLARNATSEHQSWSQLYRDVMTGTSLTLDAAWSAELAYTVALQALQPGDREFAVELYLRLWRDGSVGSFSDENLLRHAQTLIEILIESGRSTLAQEYLSMHPAVRAVNDDYLWLDTMNPFRPNAVADQESWIKGFQSRFAAYGLELPQVADNPQAVPFDRVFVPAMQSANEGPLVSVIITTFRPTGRLHHSVHSILAQTWANLEVIVVDDASGPGYAKILYEVSRLDPRIRLVVQSQNTGTYGARNAALQHVAGDFITGQDDDDWSHPQRIEKQIRPLISDETLPASRSRAVRYSENLISTKVGYEPIRPNASSLMIRRSIMQELGGYDSVRKGADNELESRMAALIGISVFDVAEPLALIRLAASSLSRSDFKPNWRHPARVAYRNSYLHWHKSGAVESSPSLPKKVRPFSAPLQFRQERLHSVDYDVVFASDWRVRGIRLRRLLDQVDALIAGGKNIAILHLDDAMTFFTRAVTHNSEVQHRLNSGVMDEIMLDDVARIRLVVVTSPSLLQFLPEQSVRVVVERVAIASSEDELAKFQEEGVAAIVRADENASNLFGSQPLWLAQDQRANSIIREACPRSHLIRDGFPSVVPEESCRSARSYLRSNRPVIGTFAQEGRNVWPADSTVIEELYPTDGSVEVRILGGARTALRLRKRKLPPAAWLTFSLKQLNLLPFLNSLDFFLFQDVDSASTANPVPLHAMAAGCVVVLPHHWQQLCGDGAVYAEPSEAMAVVRELYADPEAYRAQSARAVQYVDDHFSRSRLNAVIGELLRLDPSQSL